METQDQYCHIITDLIKKQMVMLGPNVALGQVRRVEGLKVSDEGVVVELTGDPQAVLSAVARQYMALSGAIAQMTLESVIAQYPDVKMPSS
ncbi:MAG: hypothetical protein UU73_C0006G0034 [Candidatus Daviesbacteria bacterium GW2011_GWA1_41_61]|uniref:Uncharacterized protein n=1 Tax=Candidatus Daviesbacteria bacterium GW2011_GWA2_40_9 TaxID=1618424 RepID=A0A0G0U5H3_9BACT|nr:MAG: hypothetical protein UU26_C0030G0007 [Candidatus Daviesbacteria bacterium GW2011_GWC1_40_9]KKR82421.1 MAG: hypothetical protein UU29_C0013G0009 [Candidatus Daviesbacteria bacterium GW2011_GWA2_40_9]KKR92383.1 MAG: hypothetical protein UU44_C0006G0034 [Candidatus Daviesbacteria bacterium GW2011_GWB1_41_15]KKS14571.1 MAG: hypothetical protein UU73_C0006G0034 [Candidatus Daviesbacteria bacterium GW2011_GWA1_41_61]